MAEFEIDESMFGGESPNSEEGNTPESAQSEKVNPELVRLQKEIEARDARIAELSESERYWAERGRQAPRQAEPEADPDEPDLTDDDPDKFTEELATDGIKALQKRGLITMKQAREMIREEAGKIAGEVVQKRVAAVVREGELFKDYPDLRKEDSELYQETRRILNERFAENPEFQRSAAGLRTAAELAEAALERKGRRARDTDDDLAARMAGQPGRGSRRSIEASDDSLGAQERELLASMRQYGVTESGFKKHRAAIRGQR